MNAPSARRILAEGVDNAATGRLLSIGVSALACVLTLAIVLVEADASRSAQFEEAEFAAAGGYLVEITLAEGEHHAGDVGIPRAACERLNGADTVEAAGSVGDAEDVVVGHVPEERVGLIEVSPGLLRVLGALEGREPPPMGSLVTSRERADELGLRSGGHAVVGELPPLRIETASLGVLSPGYARAALVSVAPRGVGRACFVALAPTSADAAIASGALASTFAGQTPIVRRVVGNVGLITASSDRFARRVSAAWWLWSACAVAAAWRVIVWLKRSDQALYRSMGLRWADLYLLRVAEGWVLVALGGMLGLAAGGVWASALRMGRSAVLIGICSGAASVAATLAAVGLVSLLVRETDPLADLKDR